MKMSLKKYIKILFMKKKVQGVTKNEKKVWVLLAANYGNIGDIAITVAQTKFIKNTLSDYKVIDISTKDIYEYYRSIKKLTNSSDIITIIGGGNMGNVYKDFEQKRRFIVKHFKNNNIISFPQSIDFLSNEDGRNELRKSAKVYGNNKNLKIFAREKKSFDIMKNNFNNDVYLVPDIVFSLKGCLEYCVPNKRVGVTLCLRNDKEKNTDKNLQENIIRLLKKHNIDDIKIKDTHIGKVYISNDYREKYLKDMLESFASSKLVITDRLHGMIFCILTSTPCIVFDNTNKKISSTYNTWIKNQNIVKLIEQYNESEIDKYIKEIDKETESIININFNEQYNELKKQLTSKNS